MNVTDGAVGLAAVLFDMDGLLVDTEPLWFEAETEVMERLGGPWTKQDQAALLGGSMERSVAYLLARATRPAPPAAVERWLIEGMLRRTTAGRVTVLPGRRASCWPRWPPPGSRTRSSPARSGRSPRPCSAATGFRFPVTVCGDDVPVTKPDPAPYQLAAKLLDVDPARCVALEDSPNGVASATAAGCLVVAAPSFVAVPAAPGRLVVRSLADVTLGTLRALASANA